MKYIVAIIQPDRLEEVLDRLEQKEIHLVTVTNVVGRGRQKGIAEVYRSHKEGGSLLRKVKLEIAVNDAFVQPTIDAIIGGARTGSLTGSPLVGGDSPKEQLSGNIGDGKIFIMPLEGVIRIRTGETGNEAIG